MVTMVFMVLFAELPGSDISLIYDCGFYGFYFPPAAYFRRDRWRQPAPAPLITTFP
ncbi:hypothetical protein [Klebsiella pneumoniae]|uniref:hypothetical protein n=1 Tax=Klebsiella pneumoniae TaxID=573 RepID=UPI00374E9B5A